MIDKPKVTGGVSGVDDAQGSGVAVRAGLVQGALQLADVQTPALVFIQVIVDLHRPQFSQRRRVERILGDGDHDACTGGAIAADEQFQHGLEESHTPDRTLLLIPDPWKGCDTTLRMRRQI